MAIKQAVSAGSSNISGKADALASCGNMGCREEVHAWAMQSHAAVVQPLMPHPDHSGNSKPT